MKAKLLEALKEEQKNEKLKKDTGKVHNEALDGDTEPAKDKIKEAIEKIEAKKENEEELQKQQNMKIQEKLANEKLRFQEQENLRRLHAMAISATKARQRLIEELMKNGTLLGDKSRDEIERWIQNITGIYLL